MNGLRNGCAQPALDQMTGSLGTIHKSSIRGKYKPMRLLILPTTDSIAPIFLCSLCDIWKIRAIYHMLSYQESHLRHCATFPKVSLQRKGFLQHVHISNFALKSHFQYNPFHYVQSRQKLYSSIQPSGVPHSRSYFQRPTTAAHVVADVGTVPKMNVPLAY